MTDYLSMYESYLLNVKQASANTVSSYMRDIRQFDSYVTSVLDTTLDSVTKEQLTLYFAWMTNNGKSAATVTRSLASIKGIYSYLVTERIVDANPAKSIHLAKTEKKLPQILSGAEVELLLGQPQCVDAK